MRTYSISYFTALIAAFFSISGVQSQPLSFKKALPLYGLEYIPMPDEGRQRKITEDPEGNLWITTAHGLEVWDGHQFITYGINNNRFQTPYFKNGCMPQAADSSGMLYLYENGIVQFDTRNRTAKKIGEAIADNKQPGRNLVFISNRQEIFVYNFNPPEPQQKIYKLVGGKLTPVISLPTNTSAGLQFMVAGNNPLIFLHDSVFVYDNTGKLLKSIALPGTPEVITVTNERDGTPCFIDSLTHTYYELDIQQLAFVNKIILPSFAFKGVTGIYKKDNLLFLAAGTGLQLLNLSTHSFWDFSDEVFTIIKQYYPQNLTTDRLWVTGTKNGAVYIATDNVLMRMKPKQPEATVFRETVNDRDKNKLISFRGIAEDEAKNIYASYYTGIAKQTGGKGSFNWLSIPITEEVKHGAVYSMLWYNHSLYWNNMQLQLPSLKGKFIAGNALSGHTILLKDNDSLWIYTWLEKKLYVHNLKNGTTELVTTLSYPFPLGVSAMVADPDGVHLWLGGDNFLCKINKQGSVVQSWNKETLKEIYGQVNCLYIKDNFLWLGGDGGLCNLDIRNNRFTQFKSSVINNNGSVKDLVVFSMLPYQDSLLLTGTNAGIVLFNLHNNTYAYLDKNHPLAQPEFNRSSAFKASNGKYYFGAVGNLYSFFPEQLSFVNTVAANRKIRLLNISSFNQDKKQIIYNWENTGNIHNITLAPHEANLELLFSVPEFNQNIFYSYRIRNYNEQWSEYSTVNKIFINSLPPGQYIIEVKAAPISNDAHAVYYTVELQVQQVWYKKWWVITLFVLFFTAMIWLYVRRQLKRKLAKEYQKLERQKELAALRTKISSDLHDDVGSLLSGLAMQSQNIALLANEKTKQELDEIVEMSKEAMDRMRDTVWVIDSRKDKYINLVDRMRSFAEQQLSTKNINHQFETGIENPDAFIDPSTRQNVYLIFKELITNIIKHADATNVHIKFIHKNNQLYLLVHDNGTLQEEKNTDGMGLSNIKLRAKNIKGIFTSSYDNGFKAELNAAI